MATDPSSVVPLDLCNPVRPIGQEMARIPGVAPEDAKRMARDLARELGAATAGTDPAVELHRLLPGETILPARTGR